MIGRFRKDVAAAALAIFCAIGAAPARADNEFDTTFISDTGTDTTKYGCARATPCASFSFAYAHTAPFGEVVVLDSKTGFGGTDIQKSITIRGDREGITIYSGGFRINAGSSDVVIIKDLTIRVPNGLYGAAHAIEIDRAGEVYLRNCEIRGYSFAGSGETAGIIVATSQKTRVTIEHSVLAYNLNGVSITATNGSGHVKIIDSTFLSNLQDGVKVTGAGNDVQLSDSRILGSVKGLDLVSGGAATSYGGNIITSGDKPVVVQRN